jgi:hypothetical protein
MSQRPVAITSGASSALPYRSARGCSMLGAILTSASRKP